MRWIVALPQPTTSTYYVQYPKSVETLFGKIRQRDCIQKWLIVTIGRGEVSQLGTHLVEPHSICRRTWVHSRVLQVPNGAQVALKAPIRVTGDEVPNLGIRRAGCEAVAHFFRFRRRIRLDVVPDDGRVVVEEMFDFLRVVRV